MGSFGVCSGDHANNYWISTYWTQILYRQQSSFAFFRCCVYRILFVVSSVFSVYIPLIKSYRAQRKACLSARTFRFQCVV
jgi:hypothetical protein